MKYLMLILAFTTGCSTSLPSERFFAHDGTVCNSMGYGYCGANLYNCYNGNEYFCERDVVGVPSK